MSRPPGKLRTWTVAAALHLLGRRRRDEDPELAELRQEKPEEALEETKREELATLSEDERDEVQKRRDEVRKEAQSHRPGVPPVSREFETPATPAVMNTVALLLILGAVCAAGFIVFYVAFPDTQLLGLTIGLSMVLLAVAAILAGKKMVVQEKVVEEYENYGDEEQREEIEGILEEGMEGVSRRRVLTVAAGAATATVGAAALFPLASLGPSVGARLRQTQWVPGRRVVDEAGVPFRPTDVPIGEFRTGFPEGGKFDEIDAPLVLVRLPPEEIEVSDEEKQFLPDGVMAFSKICPHAGCAISIYRHPLYKPTEPRPALVCPCHFSTFDVRRLGQLQFGPAGRDLPNLPLGLNEAGELIAARGFTERVGPSFGGVRKGDEDQPLRRGEG